MSVNGGAVQRGIEVGSNTVGRAHGEEGSRWATKPKPKPRKKRLPKSSNK